MANNDLGKTSTGLEANLAALLCYLVGWVTGLVFFLIEKDNKFVRFHAMQSMVFFGALTVLNLIYSFIVSTLGLWGLFSIGRLFELVVVVVWIVLMVKAYQGEKFKLPVAGDIAEQNA